MYSSEILDKQQEFATSLKKHLGMSNRTNKKDELERNITNMGNLGIKESIRGIETYNEQGTTY